MIFLTKLDKSRTLINLDNIKFIESTPDTLIRFVNGDMLIVLESLDDIALKVEDFKVRCLQSSGLSPFAQTPSSSSTSRHVNI